MNLDKIKEDLKSIIESNNYILYDVNFNNDTNILNVVIDKKGFLDISELEECTNLINDYLDKEDPIDTEYSLSVESRGIDKDFEFDDAKYYINTVIEVKTFDQLHKGKLIQATNDSLLIRTNKNKDIKINANDILKINVSLEF